MCAFQRFEAAGTRTAPKVSIRATGQIGLSQGALRLMGIDDGESYVVLFFDAEKKHVGILPTRNKDEVGAIRVTVRENRPGSPGGGGRSGQISGRAFLEFYRIPYQDGTRPFVPVKSDVGRGCSAGGRG